MNKKKSMKKKKTTKKKITKQKTDRKRIFIGAVLAVAFLVLLSTTVLANSFPKAYGPALNDNTIQMESAISFADSDVEDNLTPEVGSISPLAIEKGRQVRLRVTAIDDVGTTSCVLYWDGDVLGNMKLESSGTTTGLFSNQNLVQTGKLEYVGNELVVIQGSPELMESIIDLNKAKIFPVGKPQAFQLQTFVKSIYYLDYTATEAGTHVAQAVCYDKAGHRGNGFATFIIVHYGPIADAGNTQTVLSGTNVTLNGSASYDPDGGNLVSFDWSFGDGTSGTGDVVTHNYANAGIYIVTLTVTDDEGAEDTDSTVIIVRDVADEVPVADAGSAKSVSIDTTVIFNGGNSYDPDGGNILNYDWNFGDSATGTGVTPTHTYTTAGSYTVTLTVTDDEGSQDSDTTVVVVSDQPPVTYLDPVADAGNAQTIGVNSPITLSGSGSYDPDGGSIITYSWNFGDGTGDTGATVSHAYATAGTFTVALTVTDDEGAQDIDTTVVIVGSSQPTGNEKPVAYVGVDRTIVINQPRTFIGFGYDADGIITEYKWNLGDGTTAFGVSVTHTYDTLGQYTVTLTVKDNKGLTDSDTALVTIVDQGQINDLIKEVTIPEAVQPVQNFTITVEAIADMVTAKIGDNTYSLNKTNDSSDKIWEAQIESSSVEGIYVLTVNAEFGLLGDTVNVNLTVDNTPPMINTVLPTENVDSTSVLLEVTTNEKAVCRYSTLNVGFDQMTEFATTNDVTHSTPVTAVEGGNTYYILCEDMAGNQIMVAQTITFTARTGPGDWTGITGLAGLNLMDPATAGAIVVSALILGSFVVFWKRREVFARFAG